MWKPILAACAALLMTGAGAPAFAAGSSAGRTADSEAASPSSGSGSSGAAENESRAKQADKPPTGGAVVTPQGRESTMAPTPPGDPSHAPGVGRSGGSDKESGSASSGSGSSTPGSTEKKQ